MYKIAHISDLHISFADADNHGKRLVEVLTDIASRNCDHVIVTGDLVENPGAEDFQYVKEIFSHFGLMDSSKLSVIPGNHDIYGGTPRNQLCFTFYMNCKHVDLEENTDKFIEAFKETFPSNNSFPYLKLLGNIALIGINSMGKWSLKKNADGSNGIITDDVFKKLEKILSSEETEDKYKIVLIHHHFYKPSFTKEQFPKHSLWLKAINRKMLMHGKKRLLKLFKKHNVNMILNGHTHINLIYNENGLTFINSSASIMPLNDDQSRYYNIISFPGEADPAESIRVETISV